MKSIEEFYDSLAPAYDVMTNPEGRFSKEQKNIKEIIKRYSIQTALDAGSGTGFHSLLLASLGVQVTAVDLSGEMLNQLQKNATENDFTIQTINSSFSNLAKAVNGKFDAVFCLGNTLAHIPKNEVERIIEIFRSLLTKDGVLILQLLNYDLILQKRERVISVTEKNNTTFVRFYDFLGSTLGFNILTIGRGGEAITHSLQTTELYPILYEELQRAVHPLGWEAIESYGSLALTPFDSGSSRDIVMVMQQ